MSITYITELTGKQRTEAGDLIDSGGQLAEKLDREKLRRAAVLVAALESSGRIVGIAAIKERCGKAAEIGYLMVHPNYRRRGIAHELTKKRIEEAQRLGIAVLYTNVRRDNAESIGNLTKAKFRRWGEYRSAYGTGHVIAWFYLPLVSDAEARALMAALTRGRQPE